MEHGVRLWTKANVSGTAAVKARSIKRREPLH